MKFRKLLSMALVAVMLLTTVALFPAHAEGPDDHLIVHYDFLGDTLADQLKDKAPAAASKSAENLTFYNDGGLSKIENGVAYIDEAKGNTLAAVVNTADMTSTNAMTFVTRFKIEDSGVGYELMDMIFINNFFRCSINKNNDANTLGMNVTYTNTSGKLVTLGLGGGTGYPAGQWVDMAITISYDETTKMLTAERFVSKDGWANYVPHQPAAVECQSNPFATIATSKIMCIGRQSNGVASRGKPVSIDDFRIYNTVLNIGDIRKLNVASLDSANLDNNIITHYDFNGETQAEQLRDKALGGNVAENLTLAGANSKIENGVAYVDRAQGNYLRATNIADIKAVTDSMTIFMEFKASIDEVLKIGDPLFIQNTAAIRYKNSSTFNPACGSGNGVSGVDSTTVPHGFDQDWIRVAYVLTVDKAAETATMTMWYQVGNGAWTKTEKAYSESTVAAADKKLSTIFSGATDLMLGKVNTGIEDRGISFCYNDVRIYNKALTETEVKSIETKPYEDYRSSLKVHYDFEGADQAQQLTDKVSGSKMTFYNTGATASYIKDGVAHIDAEKGNYLWIPALPTNVMENGEMTIYLDFKTIGTAAAGNHDVFFISQTLRYDLFNANNTAHIRFGETAATGTTMNTGVALNVMNKNTKVAFVLRDDGNQNVSVHSYISVDGGTTWNLNVSVGYKGTSIVANGANMILGKLVMSSASNGYSFDFDDLQIYSKALTMDEIRSIRTFDSPEVYGTKLLPAEDYSLNFDVPASILTQYDSLAATVDFDGKSYTVKDYATVTGADGVSYLRYNFSELSALQLEENVTVTLSGTYQGKTWTGLSQTTTVKAAAEAVINSASASDAEKTVCKNLLNYAAAAQTYFNYNTDKLVNRGVDTTVTGTAPTAENTINTAVATAANATVKFSNIALNLRNPVEMILRFKTEESVADLTAVITDKAGTLITTVSLADCVLEDGKYSFAFDTTGVRDQVQVTIYKNYGEATAAAVSNTLLCNVESYIATVLNVAANPQALKDMLTALLRYEDSVDALAAA